MVPTYGVWWTRNVQNFQWVLAHARLQHGARNLSSDGPSSRLADEMSSIAYLNYQYLSMRNEVKARKGAV